jgi:hypothetical protein
LGALGAEAGPAIPFYWSPPSALPRFLPAIALLLLLLPKRNRSAQALWVAMPLGVILGLLALLWAVPGIQSDGAAEVFAILSAAPFGLAAAWLLAPYLNSRGPFLTFLGVLASMVSFISFAYAIGCSGEDVQAPWQLWIPVEGLALVLSLALNLAGWSCRGRFGRNRLLLRVILWLMAGWLVFFAIMAVIESPGPVLEMLAAFAIICAISLGLLLPFLLLSFANAFYRERLKELLRLTESAPAAGSLTSSIPSGVGV